MQSAKRQQAPTKKQDLQTTLLRQRCRFRSKEIAQRHKSLQHFSGYLVEAAVILPSVQLRQSTRSYFGKAGWRVNSPMPFFCGRRLNRI